MGLHQLIEGSRSVIGVLSLLDVECVMPRATLTNTQRPRPLPSLCHRSPKDGVEGGEGKARARGP